MKTIASITIIVLSLLFGCWSPTNNEKGIIWNEYDKTFHVKIKNTKLKGFISDYIDSLETKEKEFYIAVEHIQNEYKIDYLITGFPMDVKYIDFHVMYYTLINNRLVLFLSNELSKYITFSNLNAQLNNDISSTISDDGGLLFDGFPTWCISFYMYDSSLVRKSYYNYTQTYSFERDSTYKTLYKNLLDSLM